jgi:murein DD-endopeptidase MepM/ murein hydrolase activator NlpD
MITKHPCLSLLVVVIDKYITMKNLNLISEELFNKIRGRFPSVTIGDAQGKVTNIPTDARFFDFDYKEGDISLGKVNISLSDEAVEVMYSDNFVSEQDEITQQKWYNFLKELRQFSKKRMMKFDTRNINKSNLDLRDYKFLANNRGEETMSESKMYGTGRVSYQKVDGARLVVKHTESINTEIAGGRTRSIGKIYIESADGERFMYPFKHLSGARAMARHVAEGGKPFDEFGTHIVGLSEEMNKLRKFKSYMGRSAVMAESLAGYNDVVNDRIKSVKKTIESLQKPKFYAETIGSFEAAIMEDVPDDVKENWIDQLTIKQFNEELSDVFPYIYKLVSEATKATELTPEDILGENDDVYPPRGDMEMDPSNMRGYEEDDLYTVQKGDTVYDLSKRSGTPVGDIIEINGLDDDGAIRAGDQLRVPNINQIGASPTTPGATRGIDPKDNYSADSFDRLVNQGKDSYESQLEDSFENMMGQFAEAKEEAKVCKDCGDTFNKPTTDCKHDSHDPKGSHWVDANNNGIGDLDEGKEEQKIPVSEFILSMFDRDAGKFPKGETAILTAIEKDYGEQYINPGKAFIEAINAKFEELNVASEPMIDEIEEPTTGTVMEPTVEQDDDLSDIRRLSGI